MTDQALLPAPAAYLRWLTEETETWRTEGLIDEGQSAAILHRYRAVRRFSLATLLLTLGAGFVGVGVIWLVAANLDQLPPLARFLVVAAFWVAATVGAEVLAQRREHGGSIPSPVVGAVRLIAALTFGAVIFQAAQSLQVPAYEPSLVGFWGLGALLHAYLVRGTGPLVVGIVAGTGWLVWQVAWDEPSALGIVMAFLVLGVSGASIAVLHGRRAGWYAGFAAPWREVGAFWLLVGLFAAALPYLSTDDFAWFPTLVIAVVVAGALAAASLVLAVGRDRWEPLGALAISAVAVLLIVWDEGDNADAVGLAGWAHAGVSVAAYVAAAGAVAVLGVLRDSPRLTGLATAALVLFTTVQSFAVFAQVIEGAWLFLVLGVVFLATGYLADRARRQLAKSLEGNLS